MSEAGASLGLRRVGQWVGDPTSNPAFSPTSTPTFCRNRGLWVLVALPSQLCHLLRLRLIFQNINFSSLCCCCSRSLCPSYFINILFLSCLFSGALRTNSWMHVLHPPRFAGRPESTVREQKGRVKWEGGLQSQARLWLSSGFKSPYPCVTLGKMISLSEPRIAYQ